MDPWPLIKADRVVLADYLGTLSDDEWNTQSLCDDWTVKGVASHMLVVPTISKGKVFMAFASSGFNLDKMSAKLVDRLSTEMSGPEIAAKTAESAGSTFLPPGLKPMAALGEVLVHAADITEAVGRPMSIPLDHYTTTLEFMKDVQPVLGCRDRVAGLQMRATDTDWSTGQGPLVEGPSVHLLSAMAGRRSQLDQLAGDGVDTLRNR